MRADLAMAIHFHQPVGNFDFVMERACDKCYIPFLETLKKYPGIKMTFHFTGCLLEWVEKNRPEMISVVKDMVKAGQVEVMSGGFYEPILPPIPYRDRLEQIKLLSEYVRKNFHYDPRGAWVAERVWEPALPSVLNEAGIKYVILDDTHFLYAGINKERTYGYYMTEDNAKTVAVFPSDKVLRYHIPFKMPHECMDYMRSVLRSNPNATFIYGDDGEKFGEWPGTHKWVFEEKWLEKFFDELMANAEWLSTEKLSECLDKKPPLGRVYLPTSSYEEMLEWSLPADSQQHYEDVLREVRSMGKEEYYKPFLRGGFWRNFFTKYPESNHMNKKMVYVSDKLDALKTSGETYVKGLGEATKDLFRGQCNCAYWHGVFGGLYLFHLRRAIFHHLIKSEAAMDAAVYGKKSFCDAKTLDVDASGIAQVVLENREVSLYFSPAEGGALKELDSKVACQNFTNTLSRKKEAYHKKILEKIASQKREQEGQPKTIHDGIQAVDEGIQDHMTYDWYGRYCLLDHFLGEDVDVNAFARAAYRETGDFVLGHYSSEIDKTDNGVTLKMKRKGMVDGVPVFVSKEITLPKKGSDISVKYALRNEGDRALDTIFAPEFNVTMPDANADKYRVSFDGEEGCGLGETVEAEDTARVEIKSSGRELSWRLDVPGAFRIWHFPLRTVSQSEKAYELNYQGSVITPSFRFSLAPGQEKQLTLSVHLVA